MRYQARHGNMSGGGGGGGMGKFSGGRGGGRGAGKFLTNRGSRWDHNSGSNQSNHWETKTYNDETSYHNGTVNGLPLQNSIYPTPLTTPLTQGQVNMAGYPPLAMFSPSLPATGGQQPQGQQQPRFPMPMMYYPIPPPPSLAPPPPPPSS